MKNIQSTVHELTLPDLLPSDLGPMLRQEKVAELLDVSPKTLETWRLRGIGPRFCKISSAIRYAKADVEAWLRASTRRSTSDIGSGGAK